VANQQLTQAEVRNAELNLGYTTIMSQVSRIAWLLSPPEGSLVLAQQTVLTGNKPPITQGDTGRRLLRHLRAKHTTACAGCRVYDMNRPGFVGGSRS
jgi:hypothetical protein